METSPPQSSVNKGFLVSLIFVVGIGAVNFGYAIGVFNSMQVAFPRVFEFSDADKDNVVKAMTTITSIGMAVGALSSGPLTRFGKKNCIHATNLLVLLACGL